MSSTSLAAADTGMSMAAVRGKRVKGRKFIKPSNRSFESLISGELTVPTVFKHGNQLADYTAFIEDRPEIVCNATLRDENFAAVSQRLVPGRTYGIEVFGITSIVSSEECLEFLASQEATLFGAQAITLLQQLNPEFFPIGRWTASLDKRESLWKDINGRQRIIGMQRFSTGVSRVFFNGWNHSWTPSDAILCVYRKVRR